MPNCSLCADGQYQNDPGQPFCDSVQTFHYIRRINRTYAEDTLCPEASVSQHAFNCTNGELRFEQNFWRDGLLPAAQGKSGALSAADSVVWEQQSIVNEKTTFYHCSCKNSCCNVSEYGNISCTVGSRGLLCSGCEDGYFKEASTGSCAKCGDWAAEEIPLVVVLVFLLIAIVFRCWWTRAGDSSVFKQSITTTASKSKQVALKFMKTFEQHLKTKTKLFVGFFQISSLLHSSYQVPYPYTYLNFMGKIQLFSVDIAKSTPGPCIFGPGYTFKSKVYTIGGLAFLVYMFCGAVLKYSQLERPWAQKALPWLSTALFLLYPSFAAEFFDVLKCLKTQHGWV